MTRTFAACLLAGAAIVLSAPHAGADPDNFRPYCTGDQTSSRDNCRQRPQDETHGSGLSPHLPTGLTPGNAAVVG